jgi:MoxR-like ATPase
MAPDAHRFTFIGRGNTSQLAAQLTTINPPKDAIGPWRRHQGDNGVEEGPDFPDHPANYLASDDLVDAVNTSLDLSKPLLLTGNPGTGKSQLAERIAWEFNLGPVLRFEAQSLSEANELFYRFDLVGYLAAVEMYKAAARGPSNAGPIPDGEGSLAAHVRQEEVPLAAERFVKLGPLGEAIVRSNPQDYAMLFNAVFGPGEKASDAAPRPSVVLIDEIDKASRDFPNDLLNGIERLEFRIRELGLDTMKVAQAHRPMVLITSNSERDLPPPFLRRCTFFHIEDPGKTELRRIVAQRFFSKPAGESEPTLPPLYTDLIERFWSFRDLRQDDLHYRPGTSELIEWTAALRSRQADESSTVLKMLDLVRRTASTVSKHKDDQEALQKFLKDLTNPAAPSPV